MGMTLNEAIRISDRDSIMDSKAEVEARHVILATVRKYQKIEEIYDMWNGPNYFSSQNAIQMIGDILDKK